MRHSPRSGSPSDTVLDVVRRHIAAFNARSIDDICATFSEEAVFTTGIDVVQGAAALRDFFQDAFSGAELALELRRAVVENDVAACELVEVISLPGEQVRQVAIAAFYTIRHGLLEQVKVYREGTAELW